MDLKEALEGKLTEDEIKQLTTSFDIIGDIGIIEIPEGLDSKEHEIAGGLRAVHRNLRVVLRKMGDREGPYRLREFKLLRGDEDTETCHKEHGCRYKLDVETCYFSPRESTERQRIANQIKPKEFVLVMFAGIGPYAVLIGKTQPDVGKIVGIEINPDCVKYMEENIRLNKLQEKITSMKGDVKQIAPQLANTFDRVIMPLPREGYKFLPEAIACLKPGGMIHFYYTEHENDIFEDSVKILKEAAKMQDRKIKLVNAHKMLPFGPGKWKVCIEAKIM